MIEVKIYLHSLDEMKVFEEMLGKLRKVRKKAGKNPPQPFGSVTGTSGGGDDGGGFSALPAHPLLTGGGSNTRK